MVDINYLSALLEEVHDQNKALLEGQEVDHGNIAKIPEMVDDIKELKVDVKTIELAVRDTNKELRDHEKRITKLESAVQT